MEQKKENLNRAEYLERISPEQPPQLSIIIPHYKEPIEVVDKLIRSIDSQRLISFPDVEVLIVNDCGVSLQAELFDRYEHCRPKLLSTPINGGVGVARQYGIDNSTGKYIMFIDADDCLYSQHSLFLILSAIINKPNTDLFHGQFIEEQIIEEQYGVYLHNRDVTFCHAKIYSRQFLSDNNIRCHPTLRYNEDSYFNALIYAVAKKIEYIDYPLVIWCYNPASTVRLGGLYAYRELPCYIQSVTDLTAELVRRKLPAATTFLQALNYIYFQLQDEAWELNKVKPYRPAVIEAAAKFFKKFEFLYNAGVTEKLNFFNECRKNFGSPIMERQTYGDFIKELTEYKAV